MKKKLKEYLPALPFIGALLMLSFEVQPGPWSFEKQLAIGTTALLLLIVAAVVSNKAKSKTKPRKLTQFNKP